MFKMDYSSYYIPNHRFTQLKQPSHFRSSAKVWEHVANVFKTHFGDLFCHVRTVLNNKYFKSCDKTHLFNRSDILSHFRHDSDFLNKIIVYGVINSLIAIYVGNIHKVCIKELCEYATICLEKTIMFYSFFSCDITDFRNRVDIYFNHRNTFCYSPDSNIDNNIRHILSSIPFSISMNLPECITTALIYDLPSDLSLIIINDKYFINSV